MKLSFMTFMTPDWSLEQIAAGAKECGYDGVEIRVGVNHKHGVELGASEASLQRARDLLATEELQLSCLATSCSFATPEAAQRARNLDSLRKHLDLAAAVGAKRLRTFGGTKPAGLQQEAAIEIVAEDLKQACGQACRLGVTICLETHDDFSLGASVGKALKLAACPCLAANWDLMHPFNCGEPLPETWRWLKGKVQHVHVHDFVREDGKVRLVPVGTGLVPMAEQLKLLSESGYQGFLSAEYWAELGPPEEALASNAKAMRALLASL